MIPKNIIYPLKLFPWTQNNFHANFCDDIGVHSSQFMLLGRARAALMFSLMYWAEQHPDKKKVLITAHTLPDLHIIIQKSGLIPVIVDVLPKSFSLDLDQVNTGNVLCCVYTYYEGASIQDIRNIDKLKCSGVKIFEDCAISFGSFYQGRHLGLFGDAALFSFSGYKSLNSFWGGGLYSPDEDLIKYAQNKMRPHASLQFIDVYRQIMKVLIFQILTRRRIFNLYKLVKPVSFVDAGSRLFVPERGADITLFKSMTKISQKRLTQSLSRQQEYLTHRRNIARIYYNRLSKKFDMPQINVTNSSVMFVRIFCRTENQRKKIVNALLEKGVELTSSQYGNTAPKSTPNLSKNLSICLQLPCHIGISSIEAEDICNTIVANQ